MFFCQTGSLECFYSDSIQNKQFRISELNKKIDATIKTKKGMSESLSSESRTSESDGNSFSFSDTEEKTHTSLSSGSSMSSAYVSSSLTSEKSDQTSRQRRSLLNTKITELDPVSDEAVTIRGHRFRNQMQSHRRQTIIWKGFKCFLIKRELSGLETVSDNHLIRMQTVVNNGIVHE